jgi:hypothetical protein
MKLKSGRRYKNDLSDIVGIISEHSKRGEPINFVKIDKAVCNLYGSWSGINDELREFIISVLDQPNCSAICEQYRESEKQSKDILLEFKRENPNVLNENNIDAILKEAKRKK